MATVSLEQVTKVFANGVEAVSSLDLAVEEGEFVVLVGPSADRQKPEFTGPLRSAPAP